MGEQKMEPPLLNVVIEIIFGTFASHTLLYYILIQIGVFIALMITAWICYRYFSNNHYSIMNCTMSFLGSPDNHHNPKGWYYFSIAVVWKMLTDIPLMIFMFRYLSSFSLFGAVVTSFLYGICIISGIVIGFFPDTEKNETSGNFFKDLRLGMVHNIAAVLSFGSCMLANIVVGIFYIFHPMTRTFAQWFPPFIIFLIAVVGAFWAQIKWQKKLKSNKKLKPWPGEGIFSLPMWEWTLFITAQMFIYWNLLII